MENRHFAFTLLLICAALIPSVVFAQQRPERTIDEIRAEAIHRAEVGQYPLIGLDPGDVKEAFDRIHTKDKDEWAAAFMGVADRYFNEAKALENTDPTKANADYVRAWRLYSFGRWPIPSSPGKQRAYAKAIEAFLAHARFWDPPLEVVHIPFEGSEIIAYLRLPKNTKGPVPLVIAVNGLDSRKEDLSESFAAILSYGIGFLAVDGPGTGQSPIKVSETADRMLSRVIDYVQTRPEVDKTKLAVHGVSWGAYWAAKLSIVERARLRGASAQSPPIDTFFQRDFLMNSLLGNREYLFDQVPALMSIFDGVNTLDDLAAERQPPAAGPLGAYVSDSAESCPSLRGPYDANSFPPPAHTGPRGDAARGPAEPGCPTLARRRPRDPLQRHVPGAARGDRQARHGAAPPQRLALAAEP